MEDRDRSVALNSVQATMMNYLVNRGKMTEQEKEKILAMASSNEDEVRALGELICDEKWKEYIAFLEIEIAEIYTLNRE